MTDTTEAPQAATDPSVTEPATPPTDSTPANQATAPDPGTEPDPTEDPRAGDPKPTTPPKLDPRDRAIRQMAFEQRETRRQLQEAQAQLERLRPRDPNAPPSQADIDRQIQQRAEVLIEQREMQSRTDAWVAAGNADYGGPEFTERCNALADLGAAENGAFMRAVGKLPAAHKVIAELGANPAEATRILKLAPVDLALELADMARRVAATPATPKPTSNAPPPITPLKATARAEMNPDRMEPAEFQKWWNKKTRG